MSRVVLMQPYLFPYRNYYGLVRDADSFVFYDDVQFVRGFQNRNQLRLNGVRRHFTVPVRSTRPLYQRIDETVIDSRQPWVTRHLSLIRNCYSGAPCFAEVWPWLEEFYRRPWSRLADLTMASIVETSRYLGLRQPRWRRSSDLGFGDAGRNERILEICQLLEATTYVCGPAAKVYLDVKAFAKFGITVHWHEPEYEPYPQYDGPFDHYISILDLLMNCGADSEKHLEPKC